MAKVTKKHMSKEEQKYWDDLYEYVRRNIMGYDENQSLSRTMVLRLKGLSTNQFMANNNINNTANYSFKIILNTFKFCLPNIQKGLRSNSFKDENHKFNYILKIVESNLNNVYMRMKNVEKAKEKTETVEMNVVTHSGSDYQIKTKETTGRINNLWDEVL